MTRSSGYSVEELAPGMSASFSKTITEADIVLFAGVTGDINAIHLDAVYAASTPFGGRIAHGMLSAGLISATLANRLPGPGTIYLGQTLAFRAPVRPGDTVTATVTVKSIVMEKRRVVLDTVCRVGDTVVIEGEATMLAPKPVAGLAAPADQTQSVL